MPLSSPWKLAVSALNSVFASSRSVPDWLSAHAISCAASSSRICIIDAYASSDDWLPFSGVPARAASDRLSL